jgi:hypothetical protein
MTADELEVALEQRLSHGDARLRAIAGLVIGGIGMGARLVQEGRLAELRSMLDENIARRVTAAIVTGWMRQESEFTDSTKHAVSERVYRRVLDITRGS